MASPGAAGPTPLVWPDDAHLALDHAAPTVLLFAHPKCPCTRATIRQLASLPPAARPRVTLVLSGPAVDPDASAPLADLARETLRADVVLDRSGEEARRFGAVTSGHVIAYSASRRLLFAGGVTPGRGHQGPTDALSALRDALERGVPAPGSSTVFGCPIFGDPAEPALQPSTNQAAPCCPAP